jgi:phytoene dehydrogenase-like protein
MGKLQALRPPEQAEYLASIQHTMWRTIERLAPHLAEATLVRMTASPRTFARFTGRHQGLVGGLPRRAGLHNYTGMLQPAVARGLYLLGDSTFPGQSTLAVAIGGKKIAEQMLKSL